MSLYFHLLINWKYKEKDKIFKIQNCKNLEMQIKLYIKGKQSNEIIPNTMKFQFVSIFYFQ